MSITDINGIKVGHYTDKDAKTGCTVILCENGAVGGVDVRGCAPGTRETDLLRGYNLVDRIQAILLTGGSAFGLDAASGVMQYLEEKKIGTDVGVTHVPIVPGAVIFDLSVGNPFVRPDKKSGYEACINAKSEPLESNKIGAGTGATVGKMFGSEYIDEGGIGEAVIELENGIKVGAMVVVNALGDVYNPENGEIIAGANKDGKFLNAMNFSGNKRAGAGENTTIGVVVTNAKITREEANKLASAAHDGFAMAIRPVHTCFDGDTMFAMSTGEIDGANMLNLIIAAVKATSQAIVNAVKK